VKKVGNKLPEHGVVFSNVFGSSGGCGDLACCSVVGDRDHHLDVVGKLIEREAGANT